MTVAPAADRRPSERALGSARSDEPGALLARWHIDRDVRAREQAIEEFTPLARALARRYVSRNEPLEDLVQVAMVGLIGAVDRFDPDRGVSFSSFAIPTILGELKRHFRNTGWAVHVPRGLQEMALRLDKASDELSETIGRSPRPEELANHLSISVEQVLAGMETHHAHYSDSLDASVKPDEEGTATLIESIGGEEQGYGVVETRLSLSEAIRHLPHCEAQVLRMRMADDLRQVDIARRLGCSQMQVSRLLRRAVSRLRVDIDA